MTAWNYAEETLACDARGYGSNEVSDISTVINTTVYYNCSSLTNCLNNSDGNLQTCKGIYQTTYALGLVTKTLSFEEQIMSNDKYPSIF